MGVEADGLAQATASLRRLDAELSDLDETNQQVADELLRLVKPPRRSGALARTVRAVGTHDGVELAAGSPTVVYAGPIHNGWPRHHIKAQPFLTRAIDAGEQLVADRYAQHTSDAVDTATRG